MNINQKEIRKLDLMQCFSQLDSRYYELNNNEEVMETKQEEMNSVMSKLSEIETELYNDHGIDMNW